VIFFYFETSIDSLRELNAKLLAEIAELRKENAEIPKLREKLLKFADAEAEKIELRRELKGRTDELEKTIADYEKNNAVTTKLEPENIELKAEIAKLRYDINENKQQNFLCCQR
jgi:cell division protein FtsB